MATAMLLAFTPTAVPTSLTAPGRLPSVRVLNTVRIAPGISRPSSVVGSSFRRNQCASLKSAGGASTDEIHRRLCRLAGHGIAMHLEQRFLMLAQTRRCWPRKRSGPPRSRVRRVVLAAVIPWAVEWRYTFGAAWCRWIAAWRRKCLMDATRTAADLLRNLAMAAGFRDALAEVAKFLQMIQNMFVGTPITARTHAIRGQVIRVQEWLGSLAKLDEPADYQAVLCGERGLFEAALDIVLLVSDPTAGDRMVEWEESAKLKQAKLAIDYFARKGRPVHSDHGWAVRARMEEGIKARRQLRGWNKHPDRWTGHTLEQDARAGDKLQQRFGFEEWYATRYRFVCWTVHGSGLVLRMVDPNDRPAYVARSLVFSSDLAQEAARSTVEGMGWSGPISDAAFHRLDELRVKAFAAANPEAVDDARKRRESRESTPE